jgi:hypothetical protein
VSCGADNHVSACFHQRIFPGKATSWRMRTATFLFIEFTSQWVLAVTRGQINWPRRRIPLAGKAGGQIGESSVHGFTSFYGFGLPGWKQLDGKGGTGWGFALAGGEAGGAIGEGFFHGIHLLISSRWYVRYLPP